MRLRASGRRSARAGGRRPHRTCSCRAPRVPRAPERIRSPRTARARSLPIPSSRAPRGPHRTAWCTPADRARAPRRSRARARAAAWSPDTGSDRRCRATPRPRPHRRRGRTPSRSACRRTRGRPIDAGSICCSSSRRDAAVIGEHVRDSLDGDVHAIEAERLPAPPARSRARRSRRARAPTATPTRTRRRSRGCRAAWRLRRGPVWSSCDAPGGGREEGCRSAHARGSVRLRRSAGRTT